MWDKNKTNETGSAIITVIVMLVLISLGVGIMMMFSTSTLQMAENNIQLRATSLGEAGFRYAAGEYRSAGDLAAKFSRLEALNEEEVTLLSNDGSFQLSVQSYWFVTNSAYSPGDTTLSLRVLGKFPDDFVAAIPTTGRIKINFEFYDYSSISTTLGAGFNSDQVSLTITSGLIENVAANTSVQLAFAPPNSQTVTAGGDVTISSDNALADLFPERNGLIEIWKAEGTESGIYKYTERKMGSIILSGITAVKDGELPMSITSSSRIVIKKQIEIGSTGSLGSGTIASSRALSLGIFLTDEELIPADTAEDLDLNGGSPGNQETFDDEDTSDPSNPHTKLENWEFDDDDSISDADKLTVTTQMIETNFGTSSNYVTFQNFDRPEPSLGYTVQQVDADDVPTSENLNGIWGNAADNIYAVGDGGTILHYNGSAWSSQNSGTGKTLRAIWGTKDNEITKILVVGDDGTIRIKEGDGSWKKDPTANEIPSSYDIYTVWGSDWDFVQGSGDKGVIPYKWVEDYGNKWYKFPNGSDKFTADDRLNDEKSHFRSIWNEKIDNKQIILYCGVRTPSNNDPNTGFIFKELPGDYWTVKALYYDDKEFRGVWGASEKNIYVVGNEGTQGVMLKLKPHITLTKTNLEKDMWSTINLPVGTKGLNGIYGANENYIYAVGEEGTILFYNGIDWVKIPNDATTGTLTLNSVWGNEAIGVWGVGNNGAIVFLGYPENKIGGHMLPLSKNSAIAAKWAATNKYLSYSIQTKVVWGDMLNYAASGIQFRWHQVSTGKYAGYGVSFIRYDPSNDDANYNDMIPDGIKSGYHDTVEKHDKFLIVLWEQYVQGGSGHKRWIAYKDLSADSKMLKANGTPIDLASLTVRVHEKKVEGVKVNDINIYYGNASLNDQGYDQLYNNTDRNEYNATFGTNSNIIKWPVFDLEDWTNCPNLTGTNTPCETADSFTLVDNVTVDATPRKPAGSDADPNLWIINPDSDFVALKNNFTIRTSRFTTPTGASFGDQSDRSEIGLHVFGDIGDNTSDKIVSFADFAVQLGVQADGVNTESSFGGLQ